MHGSLRENPGLEPWARYRTRLDLPGRGENEPKVVRLAASLSVLAERVRMRERGHGLGRRFQRAQEVAGILEHGQVEDCVVQTDGHTVAKVAGEIVEG